MKWLLDTNVVSETTRPQPDRRVLAWISQRGPEQLAISIVTIAELRDGATLTSSADDRDWLERWIVEELTPSFRDRILPLTADILTDWLSLGRRLGARGRPKSAPDLLIAATARAHDLILVSRNKRDFAGTELTVFDPWTGTTHQMEAP